MYAPIELQCKSCAKPFEYTPKKTLGGSKGIGSVTVEKGNPTVKCPHCGFKAMYFGVVYKKL
jgi:DNA-directed RNA polymerase subunit RPC12/RpoP